MTFTGIDNGTHPLVQGGTRKFQFDIDDVDNPGQKLDLTGRSIVWAMSALNDAGEYSPTPTLEKSTGAVGGITIVDAAAGRADMDLARVDTETLAPRLYFWSAKVLDSGSEGARFAYGRIRLELAHRTSPV